MTHRYLNWVLATTLALVSAACLNPRDRAVHALAQAGQPVTGQALLDAVKAGDAQLVDLLLEAGVFTEQQDDYGATPLAIAVDQMDMHIVCALLNAGANPDAPGVLARAVQKEKTQLVGYLYASGANPHAKMIDGTGVLPWAIRHQRAAVAQEMVMAGVDPHMKDEHGNPMLHLAMEHEMRGVVGALLERGADGAALSSDGETLIHQAARKRWLDMVVPLAQHGADPNAPTGDGQTLLQQAVNTTDVDLAAVLIKAGADAHFGLGRLTPWQAVFRKPGATMLNVLLDSGVRPPENDWRGWLRMALVHGDQAKHASLFLHGVHRGVLKPSAELVRDALVAGQGSFLKPLLDYGCPVGDGLRIACQNGDICAASLILDSGVTADHSTGPTMDFPLAAALRNRHDALAEYLLENGASADRPPPEGQTLFRLAVAAACPRAVRAFLSAGADPNEPYTAPVTAEFRETVRPGVMRWVLKNHGAKTTPLMVAVDSGNIPTARCLLKAGANKNYHIRALSMWPINLATRRSDVKMMRLLLDRDPHYEERKIVIDLSEQRARVYDASGNVIYTTRVSTGKKGHSTPAGTYAITNKYREWTSTLYHASMPYFQRLSCGDFGMHQGVVPGYPASHGCIRVPAGNAQKLYSMTQTGDRVTIVP